MTTANTDSSSCLLTIKTCSGTSTASWRNECKIWQWSSTETRGKDQIYQRVCIHSSGTCMGYMRMLHCVHNHCGYIYVALVLCTVRHSTLIGNVELVSLEYILRAHLCVCVRECSCACVSHCADCKFCLFTCLSPSLFQCCSLGSRLLPVLSHGRYQI